MSIFRGKTKGEQIEEQRERILCLEQDLAARTRELAETRELVGHLDQDRAMLLRATECLKPGLAPERLSENLLEMVFRPFDLASFYVALVDLDEDLIRFPLFHEGGKLRHHPSRPYSANPGLTGKAVQQGHPLYIRHLDEAEALGAIFTEAEKLSGLIPHSWYGVPLFAGDRALGLVGYMSFQQDAFSEERRALMDALSAILALALER